MYVSFILNKNLHCVLYLNCCSKISVRDGLSVSCVSVVTAGLCNKRSPL